MEIRKDGSEIPTKEQTRITEIVTGETGLPASQIKIIEAEP